MNAAFLGEQAVPPDTGRDRRTVGISAVEALRESFCNRVFRLAGRQEPDAAIEGGLGPETDEQDRGAKHFPPDRHPFQHAGSPR